MRLAVVHRNGCNIVKLEALFTLGLVAHKLDPERFAPPRRIAHRARDETQLLLAPVVINLHAISAGIHNANPELSWVPHFTSLPELRAWDATFQLTPTPATFETLHPSAFVLLLSIMSSFISSLTLEQLKLFRPRSCLPRPRLPGGVSPELLPEVDSWLLIFALLSHHGGQQPASASCSSAR